MIIFHFLNILTNHCFVLQGIHYVMYDTIVNSTRMMREMSQEIFAKPLLTFGAISNEKNFHNLTRTVIIFVV